jgi:hypothetical protein
MSSARQRSVGARRRMVVLRWSIAGARSISSYRAPFRARFGPGGREGWRGAHQGLVDGGGAAEMTCSGWRRTAARMLTGKGVAASAACSWASRCGHGSLASATEERGG